MPDFLLLETGAPDNLLLETGDNLLLDDGLAEDYVTQVARETWTTGDVDTQVTQVARILWTSDQVETVVTQVGRTLWTADQVETVVTQVAREVWSRLSDEFEPPFLGTFGPLCWIEFDDPNGETYVFAPVQLNDPLTYYHGPKWGTILAFDRVNRALSSDDDGSIEGQTWGATFSDTSRYWRTVLGRPDITRLILNRKVRLRMISNAGRIALETPRTVALGLLTTYGTS